MASILLEFSEFSVAYIVILERILRISSFILLLGAGDFLSWANNSLIHALLDVLINSFRISLDMFCLSATFPSLIFYTNWGTSEE